MDLEELELAFEIQDYEILEGKNEVIIEPENFDQKGILIINNKCEHNDKQFAEWSVES